MITLFILVILVIGIGGGYLGYLLRYKPLLDDLEKWLKEKNKYEL